MAARCWRSSCRRDRAVHAAVRRLLKKHPRALVDLAAALSCMLVSPFTQCGPVYDAGRRPKTSEFLSDLAVN